MAASRHDRPSAAIRRRDIEYCVDQGLAYDVGMLARDAQLVAVDFESTGSVAGYRDEPWQVACVPIRGGCVQVEEGLELFLRVAADRPFNPCAPGSWRERREQLAHAPTLDEALPLLRGHVLHVPLVAHHAATEKKFFRHAWPLHRPGPWIDTLKLARRAYPALPGHELDAVIAALGLSDQVQRLAPGRAAHDAFYDAAACAVLLCHLLSQPGGETITVDELVRASGSALKY